MAFWPRTPSAASSCADGRIVELVPAGRHARDGCVRSSMLRRHVVMPGLINTHHHFYQTLTRAVPAAMDRELFPWLQALYPIWAGLTPEALELAVTVAMSELLLSGCTTTTDHHYVFPAGLEHAIDIEVAVAQRLGMRVLLDPWFDEPVAARRRPAAGQRGAGRRHHPRRQRARWSPNIISAARMRWCRSRSRPARRFR